MIPVSEPAVTEADVEAVAKALREGWISGEGPYVEAFERDFASSIGSKHAVAVSNGTAAIDVSMEALDLAPGDEVVMPAFTIISCVQQVVRMGAIPVLVDSSLDDWNMRADQVADVLTSRTRAVLAVHTYGLTADLDTIVAACRPHGIPVVEDAAEAHGLAYKGRACGSIGLAGTFSFYSNKTLTTGEGGIVVTNDDDYAAKLRLLRNLGFNPQQRFVHERLGWNLRMTSLQAALGSSQLQRLDAAVRRKREIGRRYRERLQCIRDISIAPAVTDFTENSYWIVGLVLGDSHPDANTIREELGKKGVGTRPFFCPMHLQPVLRKAGLFEGAVFPVAERLWERGLYLPSGLTITDDDINTVCDHVEEVLR